MLRSWLSSIKTCAKQVIRPIIQGIGRPPSKLTPQHWGLEPDSKGLALQGQSLQDLLLRFGSPLYVADAAALRRNARAFLAPGGRPAACEVYYSYKTNPVPGVLRCLHEAGVGAEVISPYELWLARELGVPPERIIYNGPGKSIESLREAIGLGLEMINLNHAEEIDRVAPIAQELGKRPRIGLRVVTGKGWSGQFGTPIRDGAAMAAYRKALATGVLDVVGLHAHLGGMIHTRATLLDVVGSVLDFVEQLESELGITLEVLNFGGSLATPTVAYLSPLAQRLNMTFQKPLPVPVPEQSLSIEDYVTTLCDTVQARYRQRGKPQPRICLEPGRSMTGNTHMLLTSVISSKRVDDGNFLILDAGINIAESMRSEYHHMFPLQGWNDTKTETYTVVGPICSPGDTLCYAWHSPPLREGDAMAIMDAGAYFIPFSTSFSYPQPGIVMLDQGQAAVLRRAERFEDIIQRDV